MNAARFNTKLIAAAVLATCFASTIVMPQNATAQQSREQEADDTAVDAYIYLYSLVTMDVTRLQMTNVPT